MFQAQEFKKFEEIYPLVVDLDSLWETSQFKKIPKILEKLLGYGSDMKYRVPVSYIFSIVAEHDSSLLPHEIIEKCKGWLTSNNESLRLNSIAIIGSYLVKEKDNKETFEPTFSIFINLLKDQSSDIRNNVIFFLDQLSSEIDFYHHLSLFLQVLHIERTPRNILSLFKFISSRDELTFHELQNLREILIQVVKKSFSDSQKFRISLKSTISKFYPGLSRIDFPTITPNDLISALQEQIIIIRHEFPAPETPFEEEITKHFNSVIKKHRQTDDRVKYMISFSLRMKDMLFIYTFEKRPLISFFNQPYPIKPSEIDTQFSYFITEDEELRAVISYLLKSRFINGYFSPLGVFYPEQYLRSLVLSELENTGKIDVNSFTHLPFHIVERILKSLNNIILLEAKKLGTYYSSPHIYETINELAKRNSSINLREYRKSLSPSSYFTLIQNLPSNYFSQYHETSHFLTNIGLNRILNEITHSQSIGFYSISKMSAQFNINIKLVKKVLDDIVDKRSGIYNTSGDTFYYTHFIEKKIKSITKEKDKTQETIQSIANELNIHQFHIAQTLEAHQHSIEEEIKQQDKISIKRYLDITGLNYNEFMDFIDSLDIDYLRQGIWIIFDAEKIEKAKEEIKTTLLDQAQRINQIILTSQNFRITYKLIFSIAQELYNNGDLEGIFYKGDRRTLFYTPKGIINLIKKHQIHFSYSDLFPGKELSEKDIELITSLIKKLLTNKKLKGEFDEEGRKFSSYDTIYARNTEDLIRRFKDIISEYFKKFEKTHLEIKKILLKEEEVIRPQIVSTITKIINNIQSYFMFWGSEIDKNLYKANKVLNKIYPKPEKKEDQKNQKKFKLQDEPLIQELLTIFDGWTSLFNTLEQKFKSVIFHQKQLKREPNSLESKRALYELLNELRMN